MITVNGSAAPAVGRAEGNLDFDAECAHVVAAAQAFALREPEWATEIGHLDSRPGAAVYVRDADAVRQCVLARRPAGSGGRPLRALDWGCGFGQMAWLLANRGFDVSACDLGTRPRVPELLDSRISYFPLASPVALDAPDESFDLVVSSGTLEHASNIHLSMLEVRRILRPGGWFIVFRFPNERSISEWVARRSGRWSHAVRMTPTELRFLLRQFSFRVERTGYDSFLPIFLGRRFQSLRPLRARLDGPITALDRLITRTPLVSRYSTSIHAFAQVNDEYCHDGRTYVEPDADPALNETALATTRR